MNVVELWIDSERRLQELAYRAQKKGHTGATVLLVCIGVDSEWRPVVDELMPGTDWEAIRATGAVPVARGSVMRAGMNEMLSEFVPNLASTLSKNPPKGSFYGVVMAPGRASIYQLHPQPE